MATALVTGANRGIGLALTTQLSARGDHVIAVCREVSDALTNTSAAVESGIDLSDGRAVAWLAGRLRERIDHLILNAGVLGRESLDALDDDAFASMRRQFEVNALAPLRVVAALRPRLEAGAKIAIITSRMGSIADNSSGGYYGYRMSKAAVNAAGKSLAEDLRDQGIAVFVIHPGFVKTAMTGGKGDVTPQKSAENIIRRLDELGLDQTGTFRHADGTPLPW